MARLKRRKSTGAPLAVMAVVGVLIGVLIGGGSFISAASSSPSVANYQQCSDNPGAKNVCGGGWLNGILNAGGSQYAENDATAQRLVIDLPAKAPGGASDQSFSLKYLWNKGNNHAYDSLVKWNTTISGLTTAAQVCSGVSGACPATSGNFNGGDGVDTTPVAFQTSSCTGSNSGFGIGSRDLVVYGPAGTNVTSITQPVNDSNICSLSADEYETLTVHFVVPSLPARVMFLFAGHLACGTNRTGCWGTSSADTNGSSAINGGPYHIKLLTIDGTTAGNQDNQIMSSAIAPLTISNLSSSPGGSAITVPATWTGTAHDSATITGSAPTGTVTFDLYAPGDTNCATSIWETTVNLSTGTGFGTGSVTVDSGDAAPTNAIGSGSTNGAGTYQWVVSYSGDGNNSSSTSSCPDTSEQETFADASTTDATASPTP
jgi:hypothetical protein